MSTRMSTQTSPHDVPPQSSQLSVPHLVMGLVFLGIAGSWVLHEVGVIDSVEVQWVFPLILVVAGAAGLLASVARGLTRGRQRTGPDDGAADTEVIDTRP